VVGDAGTGKSSLITAATAETFSERPVPTLPATRFPLAHGDALIHDTSASDATVTDAVLASADAVVLCLDVTRGEAGLEALRRGWMPRLAAAAPDAPVVVACTKLDAVAAREMEALRQAIVDFTADFPAVELCIKCSARTGAQAVEALNNAQAAVLFPSAPLFDKATTTLRPACLKALLRVFLLCDADGDGHLSDGELNAFQVHCFGTPLQPDELMSIKEARRACAWERGAAAGGGNEGGGRGRVQQRGGRGAGAHRPTASRPASSPSPPPSPLIPRRSTHPQAQMVRSQVADGLSADDALLFKGFLYLHSLFITRGRLESTWAVLRRFGYDDRLRLDDAIFRRAPARAASEGRRREGRESGGRSPAAFSRPPRPPSARPAHATRPPSLC